MKGVMEAAGLSSFDAVIPNEIGGMNSFEALLAAHRSGKATLDTDLVARAYPKIWQTVRCLKDIPVAPASVATGTGIERVQHIHLMIKGKANNPFRFSKTPPTMKRQRS